MKRVPRLGLTLPTIPTQPPIAKTALDEARWLAEAGYHEVWLAELNTAESYALAGALSQVVPGMRIGMGVLPLATRTVMVHALGCATLSELTSNNFALGLGTSSENIVRDWAGQPFDKPLTRMREAFLALRTALAGEKVTFAGETLQMKNFRLPEKVSAPLLLGALNPGMLRLAGELADGVVLNMVPETALAQLLTQVRESAESHGRDTAAFEVVSRLHVCITPTLAEGRDVVRRTFGPYVATRGYNRFFRSIGFEAEASAVLDAFQRGDRHGVARAMSDELCDAIGVTGPEEHVAERIRDYARRGVDVCVLNPMAASAEVRRDLYARLAKVLDGVTLEGPALSRCA